MFKANKHIYLAGPFFSDEQRDLISWFESLNWEALPIYSPRSDGFVLVPDATQEERQQIYNSNVDAITYCSFVLAVIDDFDPGTIWEMGFATGIGKDVVAYSDVPGRGLNVMLAGSAKAGFVNGRSDVWEFLSNYVTDGKEAFPRNTWKGEIQ